MKPETVGPRAGATEIAMVTLPMTMPRRATGTRVRMVVISSGSMIAVPQAWTTRAHRRMGKPGAHAAIAVPAVKKPVAAMKACRVVSRCRMKPVVGMTTAMVSMKPVASHCTVLELTPRSVMRRGSATFMMVSFRMTTNVAANSVAMIVTDRRDSLAVGSTADWLTVLEVSRDMEDLKGGKPGAGAARTDYISHGPA